MSLVILLLLRLLTLTLGSTFSSFTVFFSCSTAMSQIVLEFVAIGSLGGVRFVRWNVYFTAEVNLIWPNLL